MYFEALCKELESFTEIEAIALGGSRAGKDFDSKSDYDLYVYVENLPPVDLRQKILEKYCSYMELGNSFWELEDDCTLKNGIDIDIIYRNLDSFKKSIEDVVDKNNSHNGYTTCMWHNLLNCKILFDRNGKLQNLKNHYNVNYPKALKENIISRNFKLLNGFLPSYDGQILKALNRDDKVAVNHRVSAFLESYFDIIFAMNELTHPGEKREVMYAKKNAKILPKNFEENINELFFCLFDKEKCEKVPIIINTIISELKKCCC